MTKVQQKNWPRGPFPTQARCPSKHINNAHRELTHRNEGPGKHSEGQSACDLNKNQGGAWKRLRMDRQGGRRSHRLVVHIGMGRKLAAQ
eukprot:scaffold25_cov342-Pavlova_lutheri.AAC.22